AHADATCTFLSTCDRVRTRSTQEPFDPWLRKQRRLSGAITPSRRHRAWLCSPTRRARVVAPSSPPRPPRLLDPPPRHCLAAHWLAWRVPQTPTTCPISHPSPPRRSAPRSTPTVISLARSTATCTG